MIYNKDVHVMQKLYVHILSFFLLLY